MKILVAVDKTSASMAAAREALARAEHLDASVLFVSCITDEPTVSSTRQTITNGLEASQQKTEEALQKVKRLADKYQPTSVETLSVSHETVVDGIIQSIEQTHPDFVYVGHRQLGTTNSPVNSVAKRLISQSPVPVTVVTTENGK